MNTEQEFDRIFRQEFRSLMDQMIFQNDNGEYEAFGHYVIRPESEGYRVSCAATDVGVFTNTRHALSWCIADKNQSYALARDLLNLDQKLGYITNDIAVRAAIGDRSTRPQFREDIEIKLEGNAAREMRSASVFPSSGGLYGQRPRVIEAGAWEVKERPASAARYAKGDRVFHQKFGYGEVTGVEDDRLDVRFDKAGEKRLIDRFVEKA